MSGAIAAILVGSASMAFLVQIWRMGCRRLKSNEEKRLWKNWICACCLLLYFSVMVPGLLEIIGVVPVGSLTCAGAILCFLIIVRSGQWYRQRLSQLRAVSTVIMDCPDFRSCHNGSPTHRNGF
jgi:hypothetical protein